MKVRIKYSKNELLVLNKETNRFEVSHIIDTTKVIKHSKLVNDITIVNVIDDENVEVSKFENPFDVKSTVKNINGKTQHEVYEKNISLGKSQVGVSDYMIDGDKEDELNTHNYLRTSQNGKIYFERVQDRIISKDESIRINKNEEFKFNQDGKSSLKRIGSRFDSKTGSCQNDININFETEDSVNNAIEFTSKVSKRKARRVKNTLNRRQ